MGGAVVSRPPQVNINMTLARSISLDAAETGVRAATIEAETLVKLELSKPGTGRVYGRHTASAPGEPPAPDTGRLRNAVQTEVYRSPTAVTGEVSINTEYAAALELGTERMAPRPFASTVVRERAGRLLDVFKRFARV